MVTGELAAFFNRIGLNRSTAKAGLFVFSLPGGLWGYQWYQSEYGEAAATLRRHGYSNLDRGASAPESCSAHYSYARHWQADTRLGQREDLVYCYDPHRIYGYRIMRQAELADSTQPKAP